MRGSYDYHRNLLRHGMHPDALNVKEHERAALLSEAQERDFAELSAKLVECLFGADEVAAIGGEPDSDVPGERVTATAVTHNGLRLRVTVEVE